MKTTRASSFLIAALGITSLRILTAQPSLLLRVTKISASPGMLHITLENRSSEPVADFCMKSEHSSVILQEFLPLRSPSGIAAGSRYETVLPIDPNLSDVEAEMKSFAVTCVVLQDGSSEGLGEHLTMMEQVRTGRELQIKRLLPILEHVQASSDDEITDAVQNAVELITAMGLKLENGTQAQGLVATGIQNTNNQVIRELRGTQGASSDSRRIREDLNLIVAKHKRVSFYLSRLKKK